MSGGIALFPGTTGTTKRRRAPVVRSLGEVRRRAHALLAGLAGGINVARRYEPSRVVHGGASSVSPTKFRDSGSASFTRRPNWATCSRDVTRSEGRHERQAVRHGGSISLGQLAVPRKVGSAGGDGKDRRAFGAHAGSQRS